jgi:hypothetical protein
MYKKLYKLLYTFIRKRKIASRIEGDQLFISI